MCAWAQEGGISVFDLAAKTRSAEVARGEGEHEGEGAEDVTLPSPGPTPRTSPIMRYNAHAGTCARARAHTHLSDLSSGLISETCADAVGSVAFHPLRPVLLSVSGSRHFETTEKTSADSSTVSASEDETEGDDESIEESEALHRPCVITRTREQRRPIAMDTSIKLWDFAGDKESIL